MLFHSICRDGKPAGSAEAASPWGAITGVKTATIQHKWTLMFKLGGLPIDLTAMFKNRPYNPQKLTSFLRQEVDKLDKIQREGIHNSMIILHAPCCSSSGSNCCPWL